MTNKTKQLIIVALMCSINPIIAVPTELASINKELNDIRSLLNKSSNQEDRNRLYNTSIDKLREYQNKAMEIAGKYEAKESRAKSLEYGAHALLGAAEIAKAQAILVEENAQIKTDLEALWGDVSKKYQEAGKAFRWAAYCASNEETKTELYQAAGKAYKCAADCASDNATKRYLLNKAGDAYNDAADCASDEATKTQLLNKAGEVERELVAARKARQDALVAAEKARQDALVAARKARQDALARKA